MMIDKKQHNAVLLNEAVSGLVHDPNGIYIDGTFGRGGHSQAILDQLTQEGRLIAIDRDLAAIEHAAERINDERFMIVHGSFENLENLLAEQNLQGKVAGILLDLGVSSPQLDESERGFSFMKDGPLDMRMDQSGGLTAAAWLAEAEEKEIANVLWEYGEERFSRGIAKAIVAARQEKPITRTLELAEIIATAQPRRDIHKHPATRSFQAIRIFINRELASLKTCLDSCLTLLEKTGRLVVISFHSLEDRIVKRFMKHHAKGDYFPKELPITQDKIQSTLKLIGKAIRASEQESLDNPRARSAVLRIAEKML